MSRPKSEDLLELHRPLDADICPFTSWGSQLPVSSKSECPQQQVKLTQEAALSAKTLQSDGDASGLGTKALAI